jgi:signal transduction histidine kinase
MVHDFKNTLLVIMANAELVGQWLEEHHPEEAAADVRDAMADILQAGEAANELSRRLLYFSRRDAPAEAAELDLSALVGDVVAMVRRGFEERHAIVVEVSIDPRLRIRGNRAELHHALLNLCLNSRDAMPDGGRLTVDAALLHIVRADALRLHLPSEGGFVELTVADTGVGMDEATLARAFEPFFTTKAPGEGTGLGLATVYGVVKAHGGNVLIDSSPGRGTRFRLLLPAIRAPEGRARVGDP